MLSLFKTHKGKDYKFIDDIIKQQFNIGGTLLLVHRYQGPHFQGELKDETQPMPEEELNELNIQDLLFLENRDRKYSQDIIELKGHYQVSDLEFNLSQFGLMFTSNSLYINVHLNEMIARIGRKLMAGDVIELVHRRDDALLDEARPAINAFYVVKDASRPAEGYSITWYPHIFRVNVEPLKDSQEYKDILDKEDEEGNRLKDIISTYKKISEVSDSIAEQAHKEVSKRNFDSQHYYVKGGGKNQPTDNLIPWIFNQDNIPPNTNDIVPSGRRFPQSPIDGDYFVRTDYHPARLFVRENSKWKALEENWRTEYTSSNKVLEEFLNNEKIETYGPYPEDKEPEKQALSKVVLPRAKIPQENEVIRIVDDLNPEGDCE